MSGRVGNYARDYPDRGAKYENTQEMLEEEEDIDNLEDEEFVDQDYVDDGDFGDNKQEENKLSSNLLFLIQELGTMKKSEDGKDVYIPGPTCEKGIKDIVKYCKYDRPEEQLTKYYLGKWNIVRKDLLPLLLHQSKNKKLIYHVLTILAYLTAEPEKQGKYYEDLRQIQEGYKETLVDPDFTDILVSILGQVVNKEEKTKYHENMIELIITIVRNMLQIRVSSKNMVDTYKESLQTRLYLNFSKSGGMFDAIIYLCQNMQTNINKRLRLVYLEIFYCVLSSFPAGFLFGSNAEEEYFKNLREREKFNKLKRHSELSTRHSRFGAMFEVKRKVGGTSAITGNINFKTDDLNKLDKQRNKPKPAARYAAKGDTHILGDQIVAENHGILNEEERRVQLILKHFVADFLEHAYESVIDSVFDLLSRDTSGAIDKDFTHFFVVMAFGIECYCLEFERNTIGTPAESFVSRSIIEDKMSCKFSFIIHGIQVTLIDLLYKTFVAEVSKKKSEFNIRVYHACLHYFMQIINATAILGRSSQANDQKNAQLLRQIIFSKEFSKILKIGFTYYEPKLHGRRYAESLVKTQDCFFGLLSSHAKDRILSAKTDKVVRIAAKRAKRDMAAGSAQPGTQDGVKGEEGDQDVDAAIEEEFDDQENYAYKERKYNYYSEFSSFVDYPTIQKILLLIKDERLVYNNKKVNAAVYNYIHRIVNDLKGEWVFFQNDFLHAFSDILSNSLVNFKKEYNHFLTLLRSIVSKFFTLLHKNPLLVVESMIRFADLQTKDMIINDYDVPQYAMDAEDQEQNVIQKEVIPWSKEEDLILLENFDFFREDADPYASLVNLLRDQAYFREAKDVKMRVKLLRIDKSRDEALKLIEQTHKVEFSAEVIVTRLLLYTHAKGRHLEGQVLSFLEDVGYRYNVYEQTFPLAQDLRWPIVPVEGWQFELLEIPELGPLLEFMGCERPTVGRVWWRARGGSQSVNQNFQIIRNEMVKLQAFSERQLLDMASEHDEKAGVKRAKKAAAAVGEKPKKVSKKQSAKAERERLQEEQRKINRELAGLMSDDDEELDVAESDDDESSHQLDFGKDKASRASDDEDDDVVPIRRRQAEKTSVTSKALSDEKPLSDFRDEFSVEPSKGQPSSSTFFENGTGKIKRLKKANRFAADDDSIVEEPDSEDNNQNL